MSISITLLILLLLTPLFSSQTFNDVLKQGSSLQVDKWNNRLVSPNGVYSAGFFSTGENAFTFAVWFTNSSPLTASWMANRDMPVNGKFSKLSLLRNGDLSLTDAGGLQVWNSDTSSASPVELVLLDSSNLVLRNIGNESKSLWESFSSPTDTLLPHQPLIRASQLVSRTSKGNFSSGFYKLYFDSDNVLRLIYTGSVLSSVYWPDPTVHPFDIGRSTYNSSNQAVLDDSGFFTSTDNYKFKTSDYGIGPRRRLTLDFDGNLRVYSLNEVSGEWKVSWQLIADQCEIHGLCGPNGICNYVHQSNRVCSCIPGYKFNNNSDWSYGCEISQKIICNQTDYVYLTLPHVDFYGYDMPIIWNSTLRQCETRCSESCDCKGFMFRLEGTGLYACYQKFLLVNGLRSPSFKGTMYVKVPKGVSSGNFEDKPSLDCPTDAVVELNRWYKKSKHNEILRFLLWFTVGVGCIEVASVFLIWCCLYRTESTETDAHQGYILATTGFKKFSYDEIKKATGNFSVEIGRGAGGVVYKGTLADGRVAAIKKLNEAKQGEAEFLAEASTIGKLNHMNLIEMWGYCAEGTHRILVYEYMNHGSLSDNMSSNSLTCDQRFEIAIGTARGLAYLHEECLEWILHCDIKPQNILLDSNYQPKVADFGLSKLLNRAGGIDSNSEFSRIRGTRGYMAPEWIYNLPITSKVDVYSYGIVVLEMIGLSSTSLVEWLKEKTKSDENGTRGAWIDEILDSALTSEPEMEKMEVLVRVALKCIEEDRDARPSMKQVVEMLSSKYYSPS